MADGGQNRQGKPSPGGAAPPLNPLLLAALGYARRGWPVFPCNPKNKQPLLAADRDPVTQKPIRGTGGVSKATRDEELIRAWWKKWPDAMIGLAMGHNGLFALDFDPRTEEATDPETGEVTGTRDFTLEQLKAETETMVGTELPSTLAARTPSGGVHLYLRQPKDGEPIRNRGNLPAHVDVRGLGGYVVAPPSRMTPDPETGVAREYRWLRGNWDAEIVEAPEKLVELLRAPKARAPSGDTAAGDQPASSSPPPARPSAAPSDDPAWAAVRKYAIAAFDAECQALARAPMGDRNNQINARAFVLGQLVGAGALSEASVRSALQSVVAGFGRDYEKCCEAIENGLDGGKAKPRDLRDIEANARARAERPPRRSSAARPRTPAAVAEKDEPFRSGTVEGPPSLMAGEAERLKAITEAWLKRKIGFLPAKSEPGAAKALTALAWGLGRRASAGLIDAADAKERLWPHCEDVADVSHADIDRAIEDGMARGFDPGPLLLDLKCAGYPRTDFGLAERFLERFGSEFRFTTGKGWLGWDLRRWKVLDQDKDTLPAELVSAVFETIRAVQREGRLVADTGFKSEENPHGLDRLYIVSKTKTTTEAEELRKWGRQCEQAGKPAAIANLARGTPGLEKSRFITVPIEQFDCEKLAVNVLNGTLRFALETMPDGRRKASIRRDLHRREDLITKLAPIEYDRDAACPLYDAMLEWAQPPEEMRRYLHQVAGYGSTGDTGEHKLWFNYGRGRNGKSTTIDAWCTALGDYSGTIAIESFLDQGIKKRGDQATPDLAKLGGVRMLRASEPDRDAKLNSALIKAATGGEPMSVRALHRGFFDLLPRFKLLMSGNSKPSIPDTDDGIWGRMKLVPWLRHIDKPEDDPWAATYPASAAKWPERDTKLLDKIKGEEAGGIAQGELSGVFNRLVSGLMDWLENGFVEPQTVTQATQAYRDGSDPLARFLRLCTEADAESRVQSSHLYNVFAAWAKAAGETEWKQKGFSKAMEEKGYKKKASDGMQWLGLKLIRQVSDFVDEEGRVKTLPDDMAAEAPSPEPPRPPPRLPGDEFIAGFDEDLP